MPASANIFSLNLPKTDFPLRAQLAKREPEILESWKDHTVYSTVDNRTSSKKTFLLHDGPPYANGAIHLGHTLNKILKDFILKNKRLSGYYAPYIPGWDCHGLAIELNVEKTLTSEAAAQDSVFRSQCHAYALEQVAVQKKSFQRLGVLANWEQPYHSMDKKVQANTLRLLAKVIQNGHLKKKLYPVYWCPKCQSALAEAELEYNDIHSRAAYVCFPFHPLDALTERLSSSFSGLKKVSAIIWTTMIWTLPVSQGIAVSAEHTYCLVARNGHPDEAFWIAEECLKRLQASGGLNLSKILYRCPGIDLVGLSVAHPWLKTVLPIVIGNHVTMESGSGLVHLASAHGPEDFEIAQKHGWITETYVDERGYFIPSVPIVGQQFCFKSTQSVLEALKANDNAFADHQYKHSYPHCWRHKVPILYRATDQWFITMGSESLRERALALVKQMRWSPDWAKERMEQLLLNRPDWCISRQRRWGVPLALWLHQTKKSLHPKTVFCLEKLADQVEKEGLDAWWKAQTPPESNEDSENYQKVTDVLDVWFDSGATFFTVVNARPEFNALTSDLYLEGHDQYRGWFMSSLVLAAAAGNHPPCREILSHGFVVDAEGKKMSKSVGNVIDPQAVIEKYGADILRLWVANCDYTSEIVISETVLERVSDIYRRIRNTARYLLSNLYDFDERHHTVLPQKMVAIDQWLLLRVTDLQAKLQALYEARQFQELSRLIYEFCAFDLGAFYLDICKDRLYTLPASSLARRSAQTAISITLESLNRWIWPILSFTAQEIWNYHHPGISNRLANARWYDLPKLTSQECQFSIIQWERLIQIRKAILIELERSRSDGVIKHALEATIELATDAESFALCQKLGKELAFFLMVSEVILIADPHAYIRVRPCEKIRCERCWLRACHLEDCLKAVSKVCQRCQRNQERNTDQWEVRYFV